MGKSFFLFFFLIYSAAGYAQPCTGRITGHVHSSTAHESLVGAVVQLKETGAVVVTNLQGDFHFDSLCAGRYTVLVQHVAYDSMSFTVNVTRSYHLDADLKPATGVLNEVVVSGSRGLQNTGMKKELAGLELEKTRGLTLGEALSRINGVSMLQTGSTIVKPIIHGLHSNRILTINNGIRQEGQQWGNEHAPEIDLFIAGKLAVIKGVDELRYGSDAIGGVVLVEPRPLRSTPGWNAELNTLYFTNNRQYTASGIFEQQLKNLPFTWRVQGTYRKGANIATPRYIMNNTGVEERNFSATAAWRKEHFNTEVYYSLFQTQLGIFSGSHIGNITDLLQAIELPRPDDVFTGDRSYRMERPYQDVTHHLLKSKTGFDIGNHKFSVLLAAQYNNRLEYDRVISNARRGAQLDLSVYTFSQELTWERPRRNNLSGTVGLVAMQQDNSYSGRYLIPNYRSYSYGVYWLEKWSLGRWEAQGGLRFDTKDLTTSRLQAGSQIFTSYQFNFNTIAASLNGGYRWTDALKSNLSFSLSTRAPHVNELLSNGLHHGAAVFEVGDIHLRPEQSLRLGLNTSYTSPDGKLAAEVSVYHNRINRFIYRRPVPDEPVLTIRGAFPRVIYSATDARLQGVDLSVSYQVSRPFSVQGRASILRARDRQADDWLIWMPSDRLQAGFSYALPDKGRWSATTFTAEVQHVARQRRVPSEKNGRQDYLAPPPAYTLLNADVSTTVKWGSMPVTLSITGRNLLNHVYREYLNSFRYYADEMGRNVGIRLKFSLNHFYN